MVFGYVRMKFAALAFLYLCNLHSRNDAFIIPRLRSHHPHTTRQTSFRYKLAPERTLSLAEYLKYGKKKKLNKCKLHFPLVRDFTVSFAFKTFSAGLRRTESEKRRLHLNKSCASLSVFQSHHRVTHFFLRRLLLLALVFLSLTFVDVSNYSSNDVVSRFGNFFGKQPARAAKDKQQLFICTIITISDMPWN